MLRSMMARYLMPLALLVSLWPSAHQASAAKDKKPTLVVRIQSIEALMDNVKYLADQAGYGELAKQFEGFFKAFTGDQGLQGVNTKKPWGLYGNIGADFVDSEVILMLPIQDQKTFLNTIKGLGVNPDKDQRDIYSFYPPRSPIPVFFRFHNGYLFGAIARGKDALDTESLLVPAKVLAQDKTSVVSFELNLSDIPEEMRDLAIGQLERILTDQGSERLPGEGKATHQFRKQILEEAVKIVEIYLEGTDSIGLQLAIDQKAGEVKIASELSAKKDSKMQKIIDSLASPKSSVAGIIGKDAAVSGSITYELPGFVTKILKSGYGLVKDQVQKETRNEIAKEYANGLIKALEPVTKLKTLDIAAAMNGPSKDGHYTIVGGLSVPGGKQLESLVRKAVKDERIPARERSHVSVDVAKVGDTSIHRINIENELDDDALLIFGKTSIYIGVREDAVFFSMGAGALDAMKEAVKVKPITTIAEQFQVSVARLATLLEEEIPGAKALAAKMFKDGSKEDRIEITVVADKVVKSKLTIKTKLIGFFAKLARGRD